MKDLLDRYLAAVGRQLPAGQRSDILAELRDELLTKIELKEEAAGRPLEREELEAVLLEAGNPLIVAGRYHRVQHLVGPEIFPMWWFALKITLGIIAAIYLVVAIMKLSFVGGAVSQVELGGFMGTAVFAFGVVTLVAVVLERLGLQRYVYQWRPRQLPPAGVRGKSPFERVVEIGMGGVFLLWWTHVIHFRNWMGPLTIEMAPIFAQWFWPVVAYSTGEIVMNLIGLTRPGWTRVNAALPILRSLAAMGIIAGLLQADTWLIVHADFPPQALAIAQRNFDTGFKLGLVVTLAGFAIAAAIDGFRLWRIIQDRRAPFTANATA